MAKQPKQRTVTFSRTEIEEALDHMDDLRARSSAAGDWTIWAQCLAEDVDFLDMTYGAYHGRQAVSDFVVRVHAPFPNLRYQRLWSLIDIDRAEVIFQQQMILPEPADWSGDPFAADVWSRHRYAGEGLWCLKQDVTLSSKQADTNVRAGWPPVVVSPQHRWCRRMPHRKAPACYRFLEGPSVPLALRLSPLRCRPAAGDLRPSDPG